MITAKSNQNHLPRNHNIYTRDLQNCGEDNFLLDLLSINWDYKIDENNVNKSFQNFISEISYLVNMGH